MATEMSADVFRRSDCRLCGSTDRELVLPLVPTPVGEGYATADRLSDVQPCYPMDLFMCRACGHAEFPDVINPEILYRNYLYQTSVSLGLVEHFRGYADEVVRLVKPAAGSLVIDIGSNDGSLLKFFKGHALRVLGVDPAQEIARGATEAGVETLPDFFTLDLARKIRRERGPATLITANNVFANIDGLVDVAAGIRELLAPDGVFVFETSYLLDVLQKTLLETFFHEHLCYYSVRPLGAFFRRHGMELFDVKRVPTKGGSIRGFVQLRSGPRKASPSVAEQMGLEQEFGLDRPAPYRAFAAKIADIRNDLATRSEAIKAKDQIIAGYGASVGVTTLIYQFDLGMRLEFLVDDNPVRHNRFSPGHHIPVLPSQAIYDRKADYILVLAWAYFGPIRKRHQRYLSEGGRFIIPLPKVTVIEGA